MRKLILRLLITSVAVAIAAKVVPGISYSGGINNLVFIAFVFGLVNVLVKPIITILALPIEIATLGLFTIFINAGMLYLVSHLVPHFDIQPFWFPGITYGPILIAPFPVPAVGTAIIGSLLIGFISTTLYWLTK
ncbi:MAG: phage holin family protein [Candidatus Cloacimonetes bacterium]|nr:phage holin family protein [Candidatus Cloacimonadota bacterium]